jgi:hypothetical protein
LRNQAGSREATELSIPNIITLGRILLALFIVWAIVSNQMEIAFAIFIVAGCQRRSRRLSRQALQYGGDWRPAPGRQALPD